MLDWTSSASFPDAGPASVEALPEVTLEIRPGAGRASTFTISHVDFLIGTVPGCDLRVPGSDLPAVLCLLARRPGGVTLRKLAPTQVILVNGQSGPQFDLHNGDRITLGAMDIFVRVQAGLPESSVSSLGVAGERLAPRESQVGSLQAERDAFALEQKKRWAQLEETQKRLQERERLLQEEAAKDSKNVSTQLLQREAELAQRDAQVRESQAEIDKQRQELATVRQELVEIRKQLYDRYQERRDRLSGLQEAIDRAARKVQERKRQVDSEEQQLEQRRREAAQRHAGLEQRAVELGQRAQRLEEERRAFQENQVRLQRDLGDKAADLQGREQKLTVERLDLEGRSKQYQADILRLDRLQGTLEERERFLKTRSQEIEQRHVQLEKASEELEQQILELDQWRSRLTDEEETLTRRRSEQQNLETQLAQRTAAIEGQQTTLAALRTRLERQRDELRRHEQQLEEQRLRQEKAEADLENQLQEAMKVRAELAAEQQLREQERHDLSQRQGILEGAVQQLRQAQERQSQEETNLRQKAAELDKRQTALNDQEGVLQGRLAQLAESQERLDAERQNLRERTQQLVQAEQAREALQEQLRRRGEELATRQKDLHQQLQQQETDTKALQARQGEWEKYHQDTMEQLNSWKQQLEAQAAQVEQQRTELLQREEVQRRQADQIKESGQSLDQQRQSLTQERLTLQAEQQEIQQTRSQAKEEYAGLCRQALEFMEKLADVDLRAGNTLDRMAQAREQLRDHLAEIHTYVRQCQEDLEKAHQRLHKENQNLQDKEKGLRQQQDEHRLALASFRQQLIDWQGQVTEMKRALAQGENRLDKRQAKVEEQARQVDETSQELARQAQQLQEEHRLVADRRQEMDRHLIDMREWYRKKLRELAGVDLENLAPATSATLDPVPAGVGASGDEENDIPLIPIRRDILSLTDPVDPGDRQLGELLRKLDLVDADTLKVLLGESRRQRRSLRQVLLASGVITLYQMALMEAGNVDGLVLGPVRVIDRLRVTAQETVYHVFDPRRGKEAVLRHLAEEEMRDPVHPDEYRQRFGQTVLDHPHLARALEVLEIAGRPAVLQEWLTGLPSSDWPPLVAVPGVCFRLLSQAAQGLAGAHQVGLVHGHLHEGLFLLTPEGTLKICGLGEPPWLVENCPHEEAVDVRNDLRALGKIVSSWCTPSGVRRGPKAKPLPDALVSVLFRLAAEGEAGYSSAAQLLEDLDQVGKEIPPNAEAWDRLLRHVREHATAEANLRRSA
jgi:chromosome segregation ATPase